MAPRYQLTARYGIRVCEYCSVKYGAFAKNQRFCSLRCELSAIADDPEIMSKKREIEERLRPKWW